MKKGKLGPAFHTYLEYLEHVEVMLDTGKMPKKSPTYAINQQLFQMDDAGMHKIIYDTAPVDAILAGVVRSSVKYKLHADTIANLLDKYRPELMHIARNTPLELPFEWNTIIMDGIGRDTIIMVVSAQTSDRDYPELGIVEGDRFGCINSVFYKTAGTLDLNDARHTEAKLSHIPVEIHFMLGELEADCRSIYAKAGKDMVVTDEGEKMVELIWNSFLIWLAQFELQGLLREKTPGALPTPGKAIRRHKRRKKHEHPQFEHTVIKCEIDAPEPGQAGYSVLQSKKRMHQVRGFWRTYRKTGKKVWVKGHWRGDEKLGVIRRDVELVTHEDEEEAV